MSISPRLIFGTKLPFNKVSVLIIFGELICLNPGILVLTVHYYVLFLLPESEKERQRVMTSHDDYYVVNGDISTVTNYRRKIKIKKVLHEQLVLR